MICSTSLILRELVERYIVLKVGKRTGVRVLASDTELVCYSAHSLHNKNDGGIINIAVDHTRAELQCISQLPGSIVVREYLFRRAARNSSKKTNDLLG